MEIWNNQYKLKIFTIIFLVFGLILIIVAIVIPIVVDKSIQSKIKDKIIMNNSSYNLWGQIPGETNTTVIRNFTFYQFINQNEFLFHNQLPQVIESPVYSYQEKQQFLQPSFNSTDGTVQYQFYRNFVNLTAKGMVQDILNVGSFGAWEKMKNANETLLALNGLSMLFQSLTQSTVPVIIAIGYTGFLNNNTYKSFCKVADLTTSMCDWLITDSLYGWKDNMTLINWSTATYTKDYDCDSCLMLKDYFKLTNQQFIALFDKFSATTESLLTNAVQNYYCSQFGPNDLPPGTQCISDPFSLASVQWVSANISQNPPGLIKPFESITQVNFTLNYPPEISVYLQNYFKYQFPSNFSEYQGIQFDANWARKVMFYQNYSVQKPQFVKEKYSLLNVGNLDFLFQNGKIYDSNTTKVEYLWNIQDRFDIEESTELKSADIPKKTFVFWNYMKYFVKNFTMNDPLEGNPGQASIGSFTADWLQKNYQHMKNNINLKMHAANMYKQTVKDASLTCSGYFNSLNIFTTDQISSLCSLEDFSPWEYQAFVNLAYLCIKQTNQYLQYIINSINTTKQQLYLLCQTSDLSNTIQQFNNLLYTTYNCSLHSESIKICSDSDLATQQWFNSTITRNIPETIRAILPQSNSYWNWDQQMDGPFEYQYIMQNVLNITEIQQFSQQQLLLLLNYNKLFSPVKISALFQYNKLNNTEEIQKQYFSLDKGESFITYYRYIMVQYVFKSLKQSRISDDLLFGYTDNFVQSLKVKDPQFGGDPSLNSNILLNDPNNSDLKTDETIIMYSGKSNIDKTRNYKSINGYNYTTFKMDWFDGSQVQSTYASPWNGNAYLFGSDSVQNPPNLSKEDKVAVYVDSFSRGGNAVTDGSIHSHGGLDCFRFKNQDSFYQNSTQNPENQLYFQYKYYGLQNLTKLKLAPIFLSNRHLKNIDSRLINTVVMKDNSGNMIQAGEDDGLFMDIEPYSGIALAAAINAQANMLIEPDDLFKIAQPVLIPIYNTFRTGNWTNDAIQEQLGELKSALTAKKIVMILGYTLGGLFLLITAVFIWRFCVVKKKKDCLKKDNQLLDQEDKKETIIRQNFI